MGSRFRTGRRFGIPRSDGKTKATSLDPAFGRKAEGGELGSRFRTRSRRRVGIPLPNGESKTTSWDPAFGRRTEGDEVGSRFRMRSRRRRVGIPLPSGVEDGELGSRLQTGRRVEIPLSDEKPKAMSWDPAFRRKAEGDELGSRFRTRSRRRRVGIPLSDGKTKAMSWDSAFGRGAEDDELGSRFPTKSRR